MNRIGTFRIVWAILGIGLLLLNPAGVCAGTPGTASPSHPCCPPPPGQTQQAPSSCVCIDRQPAAPTLPSLSDQGPVVAVVIDHTALLRPDRAAGEDAAADIPAPVPLDRWVQFHQLLL